LVSDAVLGELPSATKAYRAFLAEEQGNGSVPYHVALTLTERLDAITLSANAIKTLRGL